MLEKLDSYYEYYNVKRPNEPYSVIQNPGAKTVSSLMDKVVRAVEIQGRKDYTFADVSDMARCSILFDSYSEIPNFLKSLKEKIPTVSGYISRFSNGYRGIHLNFEIDGCTVEIQLSTQKAWEVKQVTENCYSKWRSFNEREKMLEIMEQSNKVKQLKNSLELSPADKTLQEEYNLNVETLNNLKSDLQANLLLQKKENQMTLDLYSELHKDGEFASVETEVEALLLSFEATNETSTGLNKNKQTFELLENGKLNREALQQRAIEVNSFATNIQNELIETVNKTLLENNHTVELDENIVKSVNMIKEVMNVYNTKLDALLGNDLNKINDNINQISYQRYNIAVNATKYAIKNNMLDENVNVVLTNFYDTLKQDPEKFKNSGYDMHGLAARINAKAQEQGKIV